MKRMAGKMSSACVAAMARLVVFIKVPTSSHNANARETVFQAITVENRWMRRPVSGRDAVRSQVIDVLEVHIKRRPTMKKVSTAAAKQSRKISDEGDVGLDLGDRSSWYCVLDEAGGVWKQKVATTPKAHEGSVRRHGTQPDRLENRHAFAWVSRLLSELGHEAIVAHAAMCA